jgi:hypothetical protein
MVEPFIGRELGRPNTFPNSLQRVRDWDNIFHWLHLDGRHQRMVE